MWTERKKEISTEKIILITFLLLFSIVGFIILSNIDNPSDIDSYYHLRIAEQIKENNGSIDFLKNDAYSSYPGRPMTYPPAYAYILYILSYFGGLLFIWKFIPIVFLVLTAIIIFLIGKKIFNERSALLSSIFFLMTPIVFQHIFLNDVNPFVFFASSLSTYFLIMFLDKKTILYSLLFGASMSVLLMSWLGGMFFAILFYLYLFAVSVYETYKNKDIKFFLYSTISLIVPIILLIIFIPDMALGCWKDDIIFCWLDLFSSFGIVGNWIFYALVKLKLVGQYSDIWWSSDVSDFSIGIKEMQPTTIILFLKYLTVISVMSILAILYKVYDIFNGKTNRFHMLLIIWFSVVLIFMVPHAIRHMTILAIPMVLLSGWIVDKVGRNFNKYCYLSIIILLLAIPVIANVSVVKNNTYGSLPDEYIDAMDWINSNAKDKVFINYWQIGHLISYAGAKNSIDGIMYRTNFKYNKAYHLNNFWISSETNAVEYMNLEGYEYVWVSKDYITASGSITYLGTNGSNSNGYYFIGNELIIPPHLHNSLMTNALFFPERLKCFDATYKNKDVSIFKIREECKDAN